MPGGPAGPHAGLIVRQWEPRNLEFPFPSLDAPVTPTEQFYVRSHFGVPAGDAATWSLTVDGAVERPRSFSLNDLARLGTVERTVTMECAGNGRIFLVPKPSGLLWEFGGIGTAVWGGTPLAAVLEECGVKPGAVQAVLRGADRGTLSKYPAPLNYRRGLPLRKALKDVLLATTMNGAPLPPHHGFPLRAITPGWYGAAAVKWLDRIDVVTEPRRGFFSTFDYAVFERTGSGETLVPLTRMRVKSSIARPARGGRVTAGGQTTICGAAWTGADRTVARVEVSTDGGTSWTDAALVDDPEPHVWTRWAHPWRVPNTPGNRLLVSRATDSAGDTQPPTHDPLRRAYMVNHTVPVRVEIVRPS